MARMSLASSNSLMRSNGWKGDQQLPPPPEQMNYEALIKFDDFVHHCQRNNTVQPPTWDEMIVFKDGVSAAPPIVMRPGGGINYDLEMRPDGNLRIFDALVLAGNELSHHACYDGRRENWRALNVVSHRAVGSASLLAGINRNESVEGIPDLHAFVLEGDDPNQEYKEVWYYRLELTAADIKSSDSDRQSADDKAISDRRRLVWKRVGLITEKATGSPAAIISGNADSGTIEVLIPEGRELVHYSMKSIDLTAWGAPPIGVSPFLRTGIVSSACEGPAAFVELRTVYFHHTLSALAPFLGDYLKDAADFHALVPENGGLVHYWRMNFLSKQPWQRGAIVAPNISGPATMMETTYGQKIEVKPDVTGRKRREFLTGNGNLDVLLTIDDDTYFAYCEFVSLYEFKWSEPVKIF